MMTGLDAVQEIKARLSIEDVVARYVPLKRAGRSLKALCPFHSEKSPSFVVSPDRQMAYCFGCHKGGDLFQFIQEIEGVDFKEALRLLAEQAGVDLSQYALPTAGGSISKDQKTRWFEVNEAAAKFFRDQLLSTKEGAVALQYLEKRGMNADTIEAFELGYAPDSFEATSNALMDKGCAKEDLLELGLLTARQTDGRSGYDRFRGRLMFPIRDVQGRLIGFGGRALKEGEEAKYLNSPESALYHKGSVLYGLHQAKAALRQVGRAVVVEGYMDVLASHQAGVAGVVASSGTAFTVEQFKLLKRFVGSVIFSFDTDRAGEEALRRAVETGQPLGIEMKVLRVPEGKDPDECIRENPALWTQAIESAVHYLDYYLKRIEAQRPQGALEAQRWAADQLFPLLRGVSPLERDHFLRQMSFVVQAEPTVVYEAFQAFLKGGAKKALQNPFSEKSSASSSRQWTTQDYFIGFLLRFFEKIDFSVVAVSEDLFDEGLKKIYKSVLAHYNGAASWDVGAFLQSLSEQERGDCELRMILAESRNADLPEEALQKEIEQVAKQLMKHHRDEKAQALMREIQSARRANDVEQERRLFQAYSELLQA